MRFLVASCDQGSKTRICVSAEGDSLHKESGDFTCVVHGRYTQQFAGLESTFLTEFLHLDRKCSGKHAATCASHL